MAYQQSTKDDINQAYQDIFGRDASFGTLGGADYWADQMDNQGLTLDQLKTHLTNSAEGQSVTTGTDGTKSSWLGGVNPNVGTGHSSNVGTWADHFKDGGVFGAVDASGNANSLAGTIWAGMGGGAAGNQGTDDSASALNAIATATGTPVNNLSGSYYNTGSTGTGTIDDTVTGGGGNDTTTNNYLTSDDLTSWWDNLDKSSFTGNQSGGMDDFMKFMMLMSVMGGKGGGGYGGSQYGYGGLNPGGVMQAYDPLAQLQGMGTWFKDNFGSGGATTNTVNTGTAGN